MEDIIIRRTSLGTHGKLGYDTVEEIAEIAAPLLNMNENEKVKAIEDYKEKVKNHYKLNEKFIEKGTEKYVTH